MNAKRGAVLALSMVLTMAAMASTALADGWNSQNDSESGWRTQQTEMNHRGRDGSYRHSNDRSAKSGWSNRGGDQRMSCRGNASSWGHGRSSDRGAWSYRDRQGDHRFGGRNDGGRDYGDRDNGYRGHGRHGYGDRDNGYRGHDDRGYNDRGDR